MKGGGQDAIQWEEMRRMFKTEYLVSDKIYREQFVMLSERLVIVLNVPFVIIRVRNFMHLAMGNLGMRKYAECT